MCEHNLNFPSQCILYFFNLYLVTTCLMWPYLNVPQEGHIRQVSLYIYYWNLHFINNVISNQFMVLLPRTSLTLGTDHLTCRGGRGLWFFFCSEFFFRTTRELEFFVVVARSTQLFPPEFNIRLYDKNSPPPPLLQVKYYLYQSFWLWPFLMKVISETCHAH